MAEQNAALENPQVLSKEILDRIIESPDGEIKQASSAGSQMIRRRIREDGFTRRIIPPQTVTNDRRHGAGKPRRQEHSLWGCRRH
jgi:hypothetical protein